MFQRSLYHYDLPPQLIADQALTARDHSRLLVLDAAQSMSHLAVQPPAFEHRHLYDLPDLLDPDTLIVANNTQVFAARLKGERLGTGGKVEFFLLKKLAEGRWEGLMKSGARIDPGFKFKVSAQSSGQVTAQVVSRRESNSGAIFTAEFDRDPVEAGLGEVPLPPYIVAKRQEEGARTSQGTTPAHELQIYNTVYAKNLGSVAAPTAGRHFTPELIERIKGRGIEWAEITLHVGIGTFKPVSADDIREHQMHPEWATITPEVATQINRAKKAGRKVLAVGTTSARTLEGFWNERDSRLDSGARDLDLFIYPGSGHRWRVVDQMLTNFHLPESTLLMMVCDFVGDRDAVLSAYRDAIKNNYRFYSYGDAMWIKKA